MKILEGVSAADLTTLAYQLGYGELLFPEEDLAGFTEVDASGAVVAIGGAALHRDGRLWLGLVGPCRAIYHRLALRFLKALKEAGVREVWTYPQPGVEGAELWVRRLGFVPAGDGEEWRLCLQQR